jgi:hypothetical protein
MHQILNSLLNLFRLKKHVNNTFILCLWFKKKIDLTLSVVPAKDLVVNTKLKENEILLYLSSQNTIHYNNVFFNSFVFTFNFIF